MRAAVIVSAVLGAGCAIVFAAAALTATLFPNGTLVSGGWNGSVGFDKGFARGGALVKPANGAVIPIPVTIGPDDPSIEVTPLPDVPAAEPTPGIDGGASTP